MEKFLKKFSKTPGLDLVVTVTTGLVFTFIYDKEKVGIWELLIILVVWFLSLASFYLSSYLDNWVFDPLYGPDSGRGSLLYKRAMGIFLPGILLLNELSFKVKLDDHRKRAVLSLKYPGLTELPEGGTVCDIYASAAKIFSGTEGWEDKVKSRLEYSKAARVFILPLVAVFLYEVAQLFIQRLPYIPVKAQTGFARNLIVWFQNPLVVYLTLQVLALIYLYLRIAHMRNLYDLVTHSKIFTFTVFAHENQTERPREMISVGHVVMPLRELSIFGKRVLCLTPKDDVFEELKALEGKGACLIVERATDIDKMKTLAKKHNVFVISKDYLRSMEEQGAELLTLLEHDRIAKDQQPCADSWAFLFDTCNDVFVYESEVEVDRRALVENVKKACRLLIINRRRLW